MNSTGLDDYACTLVVLTVKKPAACHEECIRMELRAVEESRVDEDDMRAVTCGGEKSAEEGDFF